MDLIIFYSPDKCTMTYYINNEQAGYKIEYPFVLHQEHLPREHRAATRPSWAESS